MAMTNEQILDAYLNLKGTLLKGVNLIMNLEQFVNRKVTVTYRNGETATGILESYKVFKDYPYKFINRCFGKKGENILIDQRPYDIVDIELVKDLNSSVERELVKEKTQIDLSCGPIENLIEQLEQLQAAGYKEIEWDLDCGECAIRYRPETDDELAERMKELQKQEEKERKKVESRRKLYEELKKEFDPTP
jgi:hypothetical protein